ncbi:MAG: UDP-N-acetylmuramate--L-alanine ligase [Nitrospina sp.]|jgi:UDP-N-acetylmuramate--alanine ligase|nr:UDP-N-acetylmuramate--L-alanine ligase [Nitrospina sp.]MBT6600418.1 UDP-N-acetylmuramate--L-alanine ligase [Nitrospina sp.]
MLLGKTKRIHFVGIGGSGMSGIAEVLINQGYEVSGSDTNSTPVTSHLEQIGAKIFFKHKSENIKGAQVVVMSSAIGLDNPEITLAKEIMTPVIPRAEMLAELMRMKYGIAIAGTHGKTTTTSLVSTVLAGGELDPTVIIGGRLKNTGSHAKLGQSKFLVAEADESDGSFLRLSPSIAVVTTLDEEHMEFYQTLENMKDTFLKFINKIPFYGSAILCLDDPNIQSLIPSIEKRYITYGLSSQADYTARNISIDGLKTYFNVFHFGEDLGRIRSGALGQHNVLNTLAAVAVGMELDLDFKTIANSLLQFEGVQRRFEIVNQSNELILVDDYGHHPVEIRASLKTAKEVWPASRLVVLFQPHRYSRTKFLMKDFWSAFNDADHLLVIDIFSAGESPLDNVHASNIVDGVRECGHKNAKYIKNLNKLNEELEFLIRPGDILITLGAGDVWKLGRDFLTTRVSKKLIIN